MGVRRRRVCFRDLWWLEACHNHIGKGLVYEHCPKVETEAYGSWIIKRM
jgi:hypothetical protein